MSNRGRRTSVEEIVQHEPEHTVRNDVVVQPVHLRVEVEQVQIDAEVVGVTRLRGRDVVVASSPPRSTCAPSASRAATARARSTSPPAPRRAANVPSSLQEEPVRASMRDDDHDELASRRRSDHEDTRRSTNSRNQSSSSRVEQKLLRTVSRPAAPIDIGAVRIREQLDAARSRSSRRRRRGSR